MQRSVGSAQGRAPAHRPEARPWAPSPELVRQLRAASVPAAGLFTGMGLAGAVLDGLLIQQLLGWHPLTPDLDPNGAREAASLFFVATLATLLVGLDLLFRLPAEARRRSRRDIVGWTLLGVGLFELLVGLGDHHLAAVRHLRPDVANVALWDLAYLGVGLAFLLAGALVLNRRRA
jgi:uncharacterized membrane protein